MDAIGTLGKNVDCRTQEKVTINRKTKANRAYSIGRKLVPYLMILPAMLIFMVFVIYPVIHMVYVSFFNWNMIADMKYVGLKIMSACSKARISGLFWGIRSGSWL